MNKDIQMYPYAYIYKGNQTILIWQTSNEDFGDRFRLSSDNVLVEIKNEADLKRMKHELPDVHWNEMATMDFDRFWEAIRKMKPGQASSQKTCDLILSGWNFIEDMGRTFGCAVQLKKLLSPFLTDCYNKIFYGVNLLPTGTPYHPVWSKNEITAIRKSLKAIWTVFIENHYIHTGLSSGTIF